MEYNLSMKRNSDAQFTLLGMGCGLQLLILTLSTVIGGWAVGVHCHYWGTVINGQPVILPFLACMLLALLLSGISPILIITALLIIILT